jgi:sugar phosphate permease
MGDPDTPRIYYGWYIVAACFLIMGIEAGVGATFPVFFKPLITEFDWSRTELSGVVSIGLIVGGLVTPFWGTWADRSGVRVVVATAALFVGLSVLLRSQISTLWELYLLSTLGALFAAGTGLIPLSTAISQWFQKRRGIAMGATLVGGGVGGFIGPPVANYLVASIGWRDTYLLLGGILCATVLPIAALILKRRPQDLGLLPDGEVEAPTQAEEPSKSITLKQATRKLSFWMIAVAFFLPMMSGVGLGTHLVAMFTDMGISSQTAAACLGLIAGLSIVGRFGFGYAADRFSVRRVFTTCFIIEAIGVGILLTPPLRGTQAL